MIKLFSKVLQILERSVIMKALKKSDFLFVTILVFGLLIHIYFVFSAPFFDDESFYATIPYRLVNGDSLIEHEWHLSQFSSLFSYIPVYIWTAIKGSADGIFVFLRFTYLAIHTIIALVIYIFFRKYDKWSVLTSMLFFAQASYRTLAISYQSMFVVFLLLLTLCLVSIYNKKSRLIYIFAGACFGFCCVNNPIFCFAFVLYFIACALWTKREDIINKIVERKALKKGKKVTKKQKKEQVQQMLNSFSNLDKYDCFFSKPAFLQFFYGILIAGLVAIVFFFITGGTIGSVIENIGNLLSSSEYDIASNSIFSKLFETIICLQKASLGMSWILPLMFVIMFFDKKRRQNSHRFVYLLVAVLWATIYLISTMVIYKDMYLNAVSLPFCLLSTVCYCLTEKRNKTLFYCVYIPGLVGTFFQYLAANTHLAVIGVVLPVNNVAGAFFVMNLWKEMTAKTENADETNVKKSSFIPCRIVIVAGICLQFAIFGAYYSADRIYTSDDIKVTEGPYAGVYMNVEDYDQYSEEIKDMNIIKERTSKGDTVLLASYDNWMYMYLERPIPTYTTWYGGSIQQEQMTQYYKKNPDRIPKYIYIKSSIPSQANTYVVREMFDYTREDLQIGALLTVEGKKF